MNQEIAKAWLPLIQAVADGKTLQKLRFLGIKDLQGKNIYEWSDDFYEFQRLLCLDLESVRIKPEPKSQSYRVALMKNAIGKFVPCAVQDEAAEESFKRSCGFIRWLTDRIEYELPEEGA